MTPAPESPTFSNHPHPPPRERRPTVTSFDPNPSDDPIELFARWFREAEEDGLPLPEAMALSTASPEGAPSSRMVLLKDFGPRGFCFFTNYESRKSEELAANPQCALLFHWAVHERQVRIEGRVERVTDEESFAYFRTRDRGSRIGAWASRQSRPLPDRETLEERVADVERRFPADEVPLPPHWGGYRVVPERIELWQGRPSRLHDRCVFVRDGSDWRLERLYP